MKEGVSRMRCHNPWALLLCFLEREREREIWREEVFSLEGGERERRHDAGRREREKFMCEAAPEAHSFSIYCVFEAGRAFS